MRPFLEAPHFLVRPFQQVHAGRAAARSCIARLSGGAGISVDEPREQQRIEFAALDQPRDPYGNVSGELVDESALDISSGLVAAAERPSLVGRRLSQPLNAGDLVTRRQIAPATRAPGPDERLYALAIPSETVTGLHLQASDQVEIVVTTDKARPEQADTRVVLPVVTVFSVGSQQSSSAFGMSASTEAREVDVLDLALVGAQEPGQ